MHRHLMAMMLTASSGGGGGGGGVGANGFTGKATITIDHTQCGTADTTSFPLLFNETIAGLKSTGNGGSVENANGYDIAFYSDSGLTTLMDFEIETWSATTGELVAWVRVPTLSHTVDTVLYLGYGKSSITTDQSNRTGVWDANFHAVYHLAGTGYSTQQRLDSTTNANALSNSGGIAASGTGIAGAGLSTSTNVSALYAADAVSIQLASAFTIEAWGNVVNFADYRTLVGKANGTTRNYMLQANQTTGEPAIMFTQGASNFKIVTGGSALSTGTWYYLAGWWDGTTLKLYQNAASVGTPLAVSGSADNVTDTLGIGSTNVGASGSAWNGLLDEVRISSVARSTSYLTATYNNINSPSTFYAVT